MRQKSAQSLVEFALIIPLLALMLFGIIQYGFIFATYISVRNASAVGARHAVLSTTPRPTVTQIQNITRGAIGPMLQTNNIASINVNTNVTVGGVVGATSVQVQYNLPLIIPFVVPGKTAGGSLTLSGTTVMK
jgi:Flp pilus assembly protein TadG